MLPEAFIDKMSRLLGDEAESFFSALREKRTLGLRVNSLKLTPEQLKKKSSFHLTPIPFCPTGCYYDAADAPGKHPYHQAGLYYIQEPSTMAAAEVLDAQPDEHVLDLCAAPGGKSTQIAAMMQNRGLMISNDIVSKRARALSENIERLGLVNTVVTSETPEHLATYFPGYFDRILVDAPCSGEGMFRKNLQAAAYWSPRHVDECADQQRRILEQAMRLLRPGGTLVYSTCTFSPEEDEQQIDALLHRHEELTMMPIVKKGNIADGRPEWTDSNNRELKKAVRLWPHRLAGEGHFIAKLKKSPAAGGDLVSPKLARGAKDAELKDYRTFERQTLTEPLDGTFYFSGNQLFLLPSGCPDLHRLKVIRPGLHLGEQKKKRFEPNHALALALPAERFQRCRPLEGNDWRHYLHGETLPAPALRGWSAATIDGYPLGWGKAAGGILKNFYPKGLRLQGIDL